MAKLGEGDPRWIVQDRADGANVNNWHWSEKDCSQWSKNRLSELFKELVIVDDDRVKAVTDGIQSVEGEAFINIRKNKLVASYELDVKVKLQGELKQGGSGKVSGTLHMPYIADENHDEDVEIVVRLDADTYEAQQLKDAVHRSGRKVVQDQIKKFVSELRAGKPANHEPDAAKAPAAKPSSVDKAAAVPATSKAAAKTVKTAGHRLSLTEKFYARASDIYQVFTDENRIKGFTQSPATVDARPGGLFSWFGGSITGEFVELLPDKRIEMKWRFSNWEDGTNSKVVMDLEEPQPGSTVLRLTHTGIPDGDKYGNGDVLRTVEAGWRGQVFARVRAVFGYGV